jgi:hypothetical protein
MTTLRAHYLTELGIPEYLHAVKKSSVQIIKTRCLLVESKKTRSIFQTDAERDFLYKMLDAIGLKKQDVILIQSTENEVFQVINGYQAKAILLLDAGFSLDLSSSFLMPHPSEILNNEQLKREAWEVLKKVKKCL